ncbi:hypothetical protein AWB71_06017 [Caballeronia peredens]|nr:hypothetical protein AWB71_06017 [Caballeronia peredens]
MNEMNFDHSLSPEMLLIIRKYAHAFDALKYEFHPDPHMLDLAFYMSDEQFESVIAEVDANGDDFWTTAYKEQLLSRRSIRTGWLESLEETPSSTYTQRIIDSGRQSIDEQFESMIASGCKPSHFDCYNTKSTLSEFIIKFLTEPPSTMRPIAKVVKQ